MTLIVGTPHWGGVCINSDTRVTNTRTGKYADNAQKIAHIHGGIGMVACGDRTSAIMVRETIRKHLEEFAKTDFKFPPEVDLEKIQEVLLKESLKDLRKHQINQKRPIYEVSSTGLIGINITDQPLTIDQKEANNLIQVLVEGKKINKIYSKYIEKIALCSNGQITNVKFEDFHQNSLFQYKVKLFDDPKEDVYEVEKVPFGKIIAFGSGSKFNYSAVESKVLAYVLFGNGAEDIKNGSFHLGMIHEYAEDNVPPDERFNFKTFGGGNVAGMIVTDEAGNGGANILTGEFNSQKTNQLISKVYEKDNRLRVVTRNGEDLELEPFPDTADLTQSAFWL